MIPLDKDAVAKVLPPVCRCETCHPAHHTEPLDQHACGGPGAAVRGVVRRARPLRDLHLCATCALHYAATGYRVRKVKP